MDKFLIDGHKYSMHPEHAAIVKRYLDEPENQERREDNLFILLHRSVTGRSM